MLTPKTALRWSEGRKPELRRSENIQTLTKGDSMKKILVVEDRFFNTALEILGILFEVVLATNLFEALRALHQEKDIEGAIIDSEIPVSPGGEPQDGMGSLILAAFKDKKIPAIIFQGHGGSNYFFLNGNPPIKQVVRRILSLPINSPQAFREGLVEEFIERAEPGKFLKYIARMGKSPESGAEQARYELSSEDWEIDRVTIPEEKNDPASWETAAELLKRAAETGSIRKGGETKKPK
jgi:hypothetical protein